MTRSCIFPTADGPCLGHPEVDIETWPAICPRHMKMFEPMIEAKARVLASEMLHDQLSTRPRMSSRDRGRQPVTPLLRKGEHVAVEDQGMLRFLLGAP